MRDNLTWQPPICVTTPSPSPLPVLVKIQV